MAEAPNILLFFTDQLRFDMIHALGNSLICTPNLDRLCREGTAFTSAYSPSPVCVPARCSMYYGGYPENLGCYENSSPMPEDKPSFMDALTNAGYRTHGVGKCHYTPDRNALRGFQTRITQEEIVPSPEEDDYLKYLHDHGYDYICDPMGVRGDMYYIPQVSQLPAKHHPTQWIADRTLEFLDEQEKSDQSWYCFCSFVHPHPPFSPPNPWHKLYRVPDMPLPKDPENLDSLHTYINRFQNRYKYRDYGWDLNLVRALRAYYYGCVSFIDYQVGRVLERLEKSGELDNTLVLFTSDHGEHLGDYRCFGKRSMHDTAARVPLLARLPERFQAGATCDTPTNLVDVAPTVCSVANADFPSDQTDGVDLAEIASGASDRDTVFGQHAKAEQATYMAVNSHWKYFYSAPDQQEYLFDRVEDPEETRNLAGSAEAEESRKQMKQKLINFLKRTGEQEALDGDDWKRYPKSEVSNDPDEGLLLQDHPWAKTMIPGYSR